MDVSLGMWVNQFYKGQLLGIDRLGLALGHSEDWEYQARVCMGMCHCLISNASGVNRAHSLYDRYMGLLRSYGFEYGIAQSTEIRVWVEWVREMGVLGSSLGSLYPEMSRVIGEILKDCEPYGNRQGILLRIREGLGRGV